jgi:RNA recognition motif. (a.k.a. RRM, RBD, or RNP domain)
MIHPPHPVVRRVIEDPHVELRVMIPLQELHHHHHHEYDPVRATTTTVKEITTATMVATKTIVHFVKIFVAHECLYRDYPSLVLKDHFRVAGKVVFASVSAALDPNTNRPKGHGIVQFETTAEARTAIRIMRDHPWNGSTFYVREDIQDENSNKRLRAKLHYNNDDNDDDDDSDDSGTTDKPKGPTPPSKWKCADPEMAAQHLDPETIQTVFQILKARNQARRRRNYEACDAMREELKTQYNVHIDDRLTMWWIGAAPPNIVDQNQGSGRWKPEDTASDRSNSPLPPPPPPTEWRQIMSTKENDACIDPDLVMGLLKQRDIARREKDFSTADALLEQAMTAPSESHLTLRIHDASKTWRVWSEEAPSSTTTTTRSSDMNRRMTRDPHLSIESPPAEQCIALCIAHAPEKVDEVRQLLLKFPGREYNILKKLKQRYLHQ